MQKLCEKKYFSSLQLTDIFLFCRLAEIVYGITAMRIYASLALVLALTKLCGCDFEHLGQEKKLSRWKRYLNFPTGSTAVVSFMTDCSCLFNDTVYPQWLYTNSEKVTTKSDNFSIRNKELGAV
jgi:hypothetical protein